MTAAGTKHVETHSVDWGCARCRVWGRLPQLHCATIADVREAITRGHERRSFGCHLKFGVRHVSVVQDGKTLRFADRPDTEKALRNVESNDRS